MLCIRAQFPGSKDANRYNLDIEDALYQGTTLVVPKQPPYYSRVGFSRRHKRCRRLKPALEPRKRRSFGTAEAVP
jgi:hypothetical protein